MYTYYYIIAAVIVVGFLFMMWRDVRTLKSRVTDVVEQHNNIKKALDRHESMLVGTTIPAQIDGFEGFDGAPVDPEITPEITPEPVEPQVEPAKPVATGKEKTSKKGSVREKDA